MSSQHSSQSGLSPKTLLIAGASSAVAALVIPMVWRPGTVFAAAMTPIIVALVTELLRRPVDTVGAARVRRTARGTAILERSDEPFDPLAPAPTEELEALPRGTAAPPVVHRRRPLTARQWKLGIATGLVAFAAAAGVVTASELIAGDAVSGDRGRTTFFGGGGARSTADDAKRDEREDERPSPTPSATPDASETPTPTPTPTATPTETPIPEATATPAPTTTAPPAQPTPAP